MTKTHRGSCHCGAVQFECDLDLSKGTNRCNCSFCGKARFWMAFAIGQTFRLTQGADALSDYRRTPPGMAEPFLHLYFCKHCGMRPFSKGGYLAAFGDEFHAVNVACLDDLTEEERAALPVRYIDGRHDDFGSAPAITAHL